MNNSQKLEIFTNEYITALMFTENEDNLSGQFYADNCSMELSQELKDQCAEDCKKFYDTMIVLGYNPQTTDDIEYYAHNFWYSRNGHGVGFWEEELEDLQKLAEAFGEFYVYQGDDQLWYGG